MQGVELVRLRGTWEGDVCHSSAMSCNNFLSSSGFFKLCATEAPRCPWKQNFLQALQPSPFLSLEVGHFYPEEKKHDLQSAIWHGCRQACSNMDVRQALVAALAAKEALRRGERGGSGVQALSDDDGDGPPIKGITPTATVEAPTTPQPAAATAPQSSASALQ
eukprot:1153447-Pelagomonas_calceolata.AAC.2